MERRTFIRYVGTLGTAIAVFPSLVACDDRRNGKIQVTRLGADFTRGHQLREAFSATGPVEEITVRTVIIGGGISGLSTAFHLERGGDTDYLLLELNDRPGGNSGYAQNAWSAFPLGAHYLSLPNPTNRPLIDFMKELQLITADEENRQTYNERHLCHAPDERLLYRGVFHEGLVPEYGIGQDVHDEIRRFFGLMKEYRLATDADGTDLFNIPMSGANTTALPPELDEQTFAEFLQQRGFRSEELLWFLDYCCRDDFGAGADRVSAWAGIHYFAGRKAAPANTDPTSVMTWPEGNGFLVNRLLERISVKPRSGVMAHSVTETESGVEVLAYDFNQKKSLRIVAEHCVMACPSYVAKHVLHSPAWPAEFFGGYAHHPWLIGIVVLNELPDSNGTPLAWDNVKFGTKGLGYVDNTHQSLNRHRDKHVISVYYALDKAGDKAGRQELFGKSDDELTAIVIGELESMHPEIGKEIVSITFQLWGHGMVTPYPGTVKQYHRFLELARSAKRVHLAHTDYSGYSVFEEGFDLGYRMAKKLTSAS